MPAPKEAHMKIPTISVLALAMAGIVPLACDRRADETPAARTSAETPAADNTGRNRADAPSDLTAIDQSNSSVAIAVTAAIRKAIIDDASMSMMAQNCKIITNEDGVVTLRGPVASQKEKDAIEAKAKAVANVTRVVNELEVKAT
jgi:hyperosmotically inducible periplasmic protein